MKNSEFRKLLFKSAFYLTACDGNIAESEVAEIKDLCLNSPYFIGLEYEAELQTSLKSLKQHGAKAIDDFIQVLKESDLSEKQELQLIEVLVRMIHADNKVDESELIFMQKIKKTLKHLNDEQLIINFPRHLDLLIDLGKYDNQEFKNQLDSVDLSAFNNLNLS
ncbi:MAG: TerB family tellurite resistance protein [Bacteroidia bacterium]|nr:TerB family tellurite resistance protein [Bacteroidia bacterium]MDW8158246.1 TerB family tellurite resistance protein [Bacteroidia bacterium]